MGERVANGLGPEAVRYVADADVDPRLDAELRQLLALCFPDDPCFKSRRFVHYAPQHRFLIYWETLAAHLALHDLELLVGEAGVQVGGVAEVAVHPDFRGRGLVRTLLAAAHDFLAARGTEFGVLFGKPVVYQSSGYRPIEDPIRYFSSGEGITKTEKLAGALVKCLGPRPWPAGVVDLKGPTF